MTICTTVLNYDIEANVRFFRRLRILLLQLIHRPPPKKKNGTTTNEKKRSEVTQTLRAGCSKAEPKKFRSAADPLPGGAGRPKFNQLEMVTTFT